MKLPSMNLDYFIRLKGQKKKRMGETQQLWLKIAYYYEHIMTLKKKNNFWKKELSYHLTYFMRIDMHIKEKAWLFIRYLKD